MRLILADTSVWVEHLRRSSATLESLSDQERLVIHPLVIGELRMGNLPHRADFLRRLGEMETAPRASEQEVAQMVEKHRFFGHGIGWIDAHLIASVLLDPELRLWTRDRRLLGIAATLDRAAFLDH